MTYRRFKYESLLYLLAFLIAIALRFIQLGGMPLADAEAAPALQALRIAQGESPALAPHPFYILTTSVLFFLYSGGTNFLARLLPALIGSLLVLAPLLFDDRLKPRPSLLLAFFIALDPGMVAISRQAASPIFAIAFLVFTFGFLNKNKPALASAFAALALLSGPSIWLGLLGLGITWAILQAFIRSKPFAFNFTTFNLPTFFITFLTIGTLFFIAPNGLSAAFASIPAFITTWAKTSDVTAGRLFLSILVYQPLAFLLALIAIIRGWIRNIQRIIFLSVWLLVSLLLAIFLPSRQMGDLAWVLIPLGALAALELSRCFNIYPEERSEVAGVSFLTVFIWLFAWMGFSGMVWIPADTSEYVLRLWLLIGSLVLLVLSLLLVAAGWSIRTSQFGGVWGMVIALGLLGFSGALGSAGLRGLNSPELWWLPSTPAQANLLQATVREISEYGMGDDFSAEVVIVGLDIPSLEWALRRHPVEVVASLDVASSPRFVITAFEMNPALVAGYRGQDFAWRQSPAWNSAAPAAWMRWVVLREMPQAGETIILWARDDLFLGK
ncbi:MAG: hypothetical protein Q8L87_04350 [Anaerolineales bacterium]|nr:hypothetical protein [Anaerolineales bacterium]